MIQPVLIFGAGPVGKLALDAFISNDVVVYGLLDDSPERQQQSIGEYTVLGKTEDDGFLKLIGKKCDAFVATENSKERRFLTEMLKERRHVSPVNAIHRDATVSTLADLGHGNLVAQGARVAALAKLGSGCVLYPNVVLAPDAEIGDGVVIGSGTHVGAGTRIGDNAYIGSGVTLADGVSIGKNAAVGAGSVVLEDVPANTRVFGFPAQKVK